LGLQICNYCSQHFFTILTEATGPAVQFSEESKDDAESRKHKNKYFVSTQHLLGKNGASSRGGEEDVSSSKTELMTASESNKHGQLSDIVSMRGVDLDIEVKPDFLASLDSRRDNGTSDKRVMGEFQFWC
jgi:hypothetical protein